MTHSNHVAYGSWIFGFILLAFVIAVFWFAPDALPPFKQQILAFSSALVAGLFGFFLTGDIALLMRHKGSSTTLKAAGGIALFVVVLGWWQTSSAPVQAADRPPSLSMSPTSNPSMTPAVPSTPAQPVVTQQDSSIHARKDITIRASKEGAEANVITGNGQILKGNSTSGSLNQPTTVPTKSGISTDGHLIIESTGKNSSVSVITGSGQVQEAQ
ncbi:hypothetical protein [Thiofilum flexile]|uniref:hypothetical protein n=1 Tax=Thiofilum flexile TaxID=125627 RepID=UPI00035E092A|nr:hypothetical protein [Thiofilum flexile]